MIEVKNLVKKYGNHMAIDHLNFKIEKGQVYGFLGPNGAGKSTTMNIMTGYLGATEGEVLIDGHDILKEPKEAKKHIGYLPEIPPLYVDMQVMEYLEFAAELKGIPKQQRESAIDEVIQMAKLEDVKLRLIRNLSKGYRQRVGLAQAILGFPEIIILDEPTVGLDPKQIIEIRELIKKLEALCSKYEAQSLQRQVYVAGRVKRAYRDPELAHSGRDPGSLRLYYDHFQRETGGK